MSVAAAETQPRHTPVRPDWLALHAEPPLDPDAVLIDAHHHLWDRPGSRYRAADLAADIAAGGHRVVATVFVEGRQHWRTDGDPALRPVGETAFAAAEGAAVARAAGARIAAGIVAYADLARGAAAGDVLDAHAVAAGGRLRGVREPSVWHADPSARGSAVSAPPGLLYDPAMRAGLAEVARRGLTYDAWMYHTQLGDLVDLARALPDLRIVLDHQGGPLGIGPYAGRRAEVFADWRHWMARLAGCPNVSVKLGGFGMPMAGFGFADRPRPPTSEALAEAWAPWHLAAVELFGPGRCMVESNFPVDKGAAAYGTVWNAFKRIFAGHSAADRHALFCGTAASVYRLEV